MEKFFPEGRRLLIFKILFGALFTVLIVFLFHRQFFQYQEFIEQERKQGQRRIIRPGPRGDIFDRNGKLLIGNKAHFSAKLHIDSIDKEIWKTKKEFRKTSLLLIEKLKTKSSLTIEELIKWAFGEIKDNDIFIRFSGRAKEINGTFERVSLFFQGNRIDVTQDRKGLWFSEIQYINHRNKVSLEILNSEEKVTVNVANLFNLSFQMEKNGKFLTLYPKIPDSEKTSFLSSILSDKPSWEKVFSSSATSILWKARLSVVQRYTDIVNSLTGRKKKFTVKELIRHWREKLLLPVPLANNLNPEGVCQSS